MAMLLTNAALAETVVVSDLLPINVRDGAGPRDRIIAAVKSGDRLEVLERVPGYVKILTPKGNEGWVLARFVQDEPVARDLLAQAQQEIEDLRLQAQELTALRAENQRLQTLADELQVQLATDVPPVQDAPPAAAETAALNAQLAELREKNLRMGEELDMLRNRRNQLMLGAGLLFCGLLLGLILPYLRPRPRNWSNY